MSHWDGKRIVRWQTGPVEGYPDWERIDCGCCAGLEWGGEEPRECRRCHEFGWLCRHKPIGTLALWPGGPLAGREMVAA